MKEEDFRKIIPEVKPYLHPIMYDDTFKVTKMYKQYIISSGEGISELTCKVGCYLEVGIKKQQGVIRKEVPCHAILGAEPKFFTMYLSDCVDGCMNNLSEHGHEVVLCMKQN